MRILRLNFEQKSVRWINLIAAIVIAGLTTPIVKWLILHGGKLGISNPDAISFCNILFIGNFLSGIVVLLFFGWHDVGRDIRRARAKTVWLLLGNLLIGTVMGPIFLYTALETTMVTNLVLLTRIEAVIYPALGLFFFKDPVSKLSWLGLSLIVAGAAVLVLFQGGGKIAAGDVLGIFAGSLFAVGSLMGRIILRDLSIYTFVFCRNLLGSIIFFWIAVILYGFHHFGDAFSANLWVVMFVYAAVVVVLGDLSWFKALATVASVTVSAWATLTPVLGILFAYLLLGERPDAAQWLAAAIILSGMAISQLKPKESEAPPRVLERALAGA